MESLIETGKAPALSQAGAAREVGYNLSVDRHPSPVMLFVAA